MQRLTAIGPKIIGAEIIFFHWYNLVYCYLLSDGRALQIIEIVLNSKQFLASASNFLLKLNKWKQIQHTEVEF